MSPEICVHLYTLATKEPSGLEHFSLVAQRPETPIPKGDVEVPGGHPQ